MEDLGSVKLSDILAHSGVKGMKWGVTAAKSTPRSKAITAGKVKKGYTAKNAVRGNRARRWAGTLVGTNAGSAISSHVLLSTGAVKIAGGVITAGLGAAVAGTAAGIVVGGVAANRLMRKYGKRRLNEVKAIKTKARAKKP